MAHLSNRDLLEKADLVIADLTAGGGYLVPEQAKTFMRLLIKQSVLMQMATVTPMAAPKKQVPKIKFGSRILRSGAEAVPLAPEARSKPDLSFVELDAKLFKAEVHLTDEVLEDNVERGELRQTILDMMAEAIARDMEEVLIQGSTASTDPFLQQMNGLLVQAQSHLVDAAGAPLTKDLLRDMLRSMPSEYLRDRRQMAYLVSVDSELGYRNLLAERATVAGDKFLETDAPVLYSGVPVRPVPLLPENLGTGNQTNALLCNPKNVYVGIWRQIRLETWRDISAGVLRVVATLRFDAKYADENGVVKAINVAV
ncbi:MAG TPA: phage major capsid protein [Polyangiaceae bacterium]|nr:phage major capsid protein [Polyangiaceae bacterium]